VQEQLAGAEPAGIEVGVISDGDFPGLGDEGVGGKKDGFRPAPHADADYEGCGQRKPRVAEEVHAGILTARVGDSW